MARRAPKRQRDSSLARAVEKASARFGWNDKCSVDVAAVMRGLASECGDFAEHEELLARVDRVLHS
jgi:hypothetical protein